MRDPATITDRVGVCALDGEIVPDPRVPLAADCADHAPAAARLADVLADREQPGGHPAALPREERVLGGGQQPVAVDGQVGRRGVGVGEGGGDAIALGLAASNLTLLDWWSPIPYFASWSACGSADILGDLPTEG